MKKIFLRFLFPIVISIFCASALIYLVIRFVFGDPIEKSAHDQAMPHVLLIEQYIDSANKDEWLSRLNKVREISQVHFDLIPMTAASQLLNEKQNQTLLKGEVVIDSDSQSLFRRVDLKGEKYVGSDEDVIHAKNLPIDVWLIFKMELLRIFIISLVILMPIAYWSRSHWRDVTSMIQFAEEYGEGKLQGRSQLPTSSMIFDLSQQMNQMAERIENLIRAQKTLLHSVSHELRTPISRLTFGLELLYHNEDISENSIKKIAAMQTDINELNDLVSDLLEMSVLEQGGRKLSLERLDMQEFIQHCVLQQQPLIGQKSLSVEIKESSKFLMIDVKLLQRAIGNILKNAVKYSRSSIAIRIDTNAKDEIEIVLEDDGDGILDSDAEKIFQPFFRVDNSRNKLTGGYGLGLSIALQAIKIHLGKIELYRSQLGGARFVITLPIIEVV